MALSKPTLTTMIETNLSTFPGLVIKDSNVLHQVSRAIAEAVVDHIVAAAVVTSTTSTPNAQSGTTTLPGTATGTIS